MKLCSIVRIALKPLNVNNTTINNRISSFMYVANIKRYSCKSVYKEELKVGTFCELSVKSTFAVQVRPVDVHVHSIDDMLKVNVLSKHPECKVHVNCVQNGGNVNITCDSNYPKETQCILEAPVKSDINIETTTGDIDVRKFYGNKLILKSESGNIKSEGCRNDEICIQSNSGNIRNVGTLQAALINISTAGLGSIDSDHIQSVKTQMRSQSGNIRIGSAYCDCSEFTTDSGCLHLDNIHQGCNVSITNNGSLRMIGFDGTLHAMVKHGNVVMQIARLHGASNIKIGGESDVLIRLSDSVQECCELRVLSRELIVADTLELEAREDGEWTSLCSGKQMGRSELVVNASVGRVTVERASWLDALRSQ